MARVLVADDSDGVREVCARRLEVLGHEVIAAASGSEALSQFIQQRPQAVLLDVEMPEMDGWAVLEAIRTLDPAASVAMLTGARDAQSVRRALLLGARDYLIKPFRGARFDEALARLLQA